MIPFIPLPAHATAGDTDNNKRARETDDTDDTDQRVIHVTVSGKYRSGTKISIPRGGELVPENYDIDREIDEIKVTVSQMLKEKDPNKKLLMMPHSLHWTEEEMNLDLWFVLFPIKVFAVIAATIKGKNLRPIDTLKFHFAKPDDSQGANQHHVAFKKEPPNPATIANPSDDRPRTVTVSVADFDKL